ncbi:uncharacterized protein LOC109821777 [Asparagus officinalis]|uniref:uncharacterized protein LOC109821777 n=1 Tax=Asparagus officinalis TaxID=4686 RepID=UPI00098E7230|nr:uncharacterized protein LOC109821777 [Asparagus officinalis]
MAKRFAIETVDRTLRDVMGDKRFFGGKVVVFGGDFRQVLPVVPRGTRAETINASLMKSYLWEKMEKLSLTINMRVRTDQVFGEFLLRVGNGEEPTIDENLILLPHEMVVEYDNDENSEKNLIDAIFPSLQSNSSSAEYMTQRAILSTRNEYVDGLNEKLIALFPGEARTFFSFDEAVDDTNNYYQEEFLNTLMPNGLPPHKLILKRNCSIMLLRNLDPSNGMCNDTRMICRGYEHNVIHAEITIGQHSARSIIASKVMDSSYYRSNCLAAVRFPMALYSLTKMHLLKLINPAKIELLSVYLYQT